MPDQHRPGTVEARPSIRERNSHDAVIDLREEKAITTRLQSPGPVGGTQPSAASADTLSAKPSIRRWAMRAVVGDVLAVVAATTLAQTVRFGFDETLLAAEAALMSYTVLGFGIVAMWPIALALSGAYEHRVSMFGVEEIRRVLRATVGLLALLAVLDYVLRLNLARGYLGILLPALVVLTVAWRMGLRSCTSRERRQGRSRHRVVAVGPVGDLCRVVTQLRSRADSPIDIVAVVADDRDEHEPLPAPLDSLPRLRSRDGIAELTRAGANVDLLLRAGRPAGEEMWALTRRAHDAGVGLAIAPSRTDPHNVNLSYLPLGSTPLLVVETPALKPAQALAKAAFDRLATVLLLLVAAPLLSAIAIAILVTDGRPILFRQQRVGKDGRLFSCLKFRTMVCDAEAKIAGLRDRNEADGPLFKVRRDPRVTVVGRVLRRFSLDELPQLGNILRGDMSLVGPRPPLPDEVASYDARVARRLLVKPGLTGLWQVSGRSDLPWDDGVYLDLLYVDHWSPLLDAVILARTLVAVLRPRGAY